MEKLSGESKENNILLVPRMRTVKQCVSYLKEQDTECCIGEWYVRRLVNQNEIPVRRSGRRILINLDTLIEYLAGGEDLRK